jgi:hypothetical protein
MCENFVNFRYRAGATFDVQVATFWFLGIFLATFGILGSNFSDFRWQLSRILRAQSGRAYSFHPIDLHQLADFAIFRTLLPR